MGLAKYNCFTYGFPFAHNKYFPQILFCPLLKDMELQ